MTHAALRTCSMIAVIGLASVAALGVDPPDSLINLQSGLIETVDATWSGSNYNVRYTVVNGRGVQTNSILLSTNTKDDLDPRIAISPIGDSYVTWWRDLSIDSILYRKESYATGAWGTERLVGFPTESNSRPRIIAAFDKVWVVYQIQNTSKSRSIGAQVIDDDPEPVRSIISTTSYGGDLDTQANYEAGQFWITWIDTSSRVGYSQYSYDKRLWTAASYESFAADSPAQARARIRLRLLNF